MGEHLIPFAPPTPLSASGGATARRLYSRGLLFIKCRLWVTERTSGLIKYHQQSLKVHNMDCWQYFFPVILRPRGHTGKCGLEVNIFASALASTSWPRAFGVGVVSVLLTWPRKCAIRCKLILYMSILWLYHCNIHY